MNTITEKQIADFLRVMKGREKSQNTLKAYSTDINQFAAYLGEQKLSKDTVIAYKEQLTKGAKANTVNRKIIALNGFLKSISRNDLVVKQLRIQAVLTLDNVMSIKDFERVMKYADIKGEYQAAAIMQTLAGTGIRIGELKYLTVECLHKGVMTVSNKGTIRDIPLAAIKKPITDYCKRKGIKQGMIFATRNGTPISNPQISRILKKIAGAARVNKSKIHPHSFRHLFAINFLNKGGSITELRDILGHKSFDTTSIYTRATTKQKADTMEKVSLLKNIKKNRKAN